MKSDKKTEKSERVEGKNKSEGKASERVDSGVSPVAYDSLVMNGLHQQLQLHMLMTLDTGQGQRADSTEGLCVSVRECECLLGHVSNSKSESRT